MVQFFFEESYLIDCDTLRCLIMVHPIERINGAKCYLALKNLNLLTFLSYTLSVSCKNKNVSLYYLLHTFWEICSILD